MNLMGTGERAWTWKAMFACQKILKSVFYRRSDFGLLLNPLDEPHRNRFVCNCDYDLFLLLFIRIAIAIYQRLKCMPNRFLFPLCMWRIIYLFIVWSFRDLRGGRLSGNWMIHAALFASPWKNAFLTRLKSSGVLIEFEPTKLLVVKNLYFGFVLRCTFSLSLERNSKRKIVCAVRRS